MFCKLHQLFKMSRMSRLGVRTLQQTLVLNVPTWCKNITTDFSIEARLTCLAFACVYVKYS
jgi:hypothetical protein